MTNIYNAITKHLPVSEQPYEKCKSYGASTLTDYELLAVILRSGVPGTNSIEMSKQVLSAAGEYGIAGLGNLNLNKLTSINGIGEVKAIMILCIIELAKRYAKSSIRPTLEFSNSKSVASYYMQEMRSYEKETLIAIMLNTKNMYLGESIVSVGTVNASFISPREVFIDALEKKAVRIILIHNHPSGNPTPSKEDLTATSRIREAGRLLDIELLDHIIIGDNRYISLKERNLL